MLDFEDLTPGPHELSLDFLERCVAHVLPRPIRLLRRWLRCLWRPRGGRFRRLRRGRLSFSCLGLTQWMRKCDLTWSNNTYAILQYIVKYYHFLIPYQTSTWEGEGVERKPALAFWLARGRVKLHLIHMAWLKHEVPQHQQLLSGHNFPIIKWTFLG